MAQTGKFEIITSNVVRNPRLERRIIELNRERIIYGMILAGAVLLLLAVMW